MPTAGDVEKALKAALDATDVVRAALLTCSELADESDGLTCSCRVDRH